MLMEEGRAESLGLADCYSGVTFLFCFCFIISVYAPLNSPSTRRLTQHNRKKNSTAAVKPQRIGKIKKKTAARYLQRQRKNRSIIPMVWNTIKTIMFFRRRARVMIGRRRKLFESLIGNRRSVIFLYLPPAPGAKGKWNYASSQIPPFVEFVFFSCRFGNCWKWRIELKWIACNASKERLTRLDSCQMRLQIEYSKGTQQPL